METDTIAAIATAMGNSGIAIIRVSGDKSIDIAAKIFNPKNEMTDIRKVKSHTIHYGNITDDTDGRIKTADEVLLSVMRAPKTYTTEDVVEINCHGGMIAAYKILNILLKNGARLAQPGEFTKRAYINGRIDLSQAEAVTDIINAKNDYAFKSALNLLKGGVSKKVKELREIILTNTAFMEAALDDPEHISLENYGDKLLNDLQYVNNQIDNLIKSSENGRILTQGINTVIIGKPNAGKSSFLNAIIGEDRAIVTDIEGTTRDTIEENIKINGISLNITDTAGIRNTDNIVEKIGIEKAKKSAEEADLILYIVDGSKKIDENDKIIIDIIKDKKVIILINKIDIVDDKDYYDNIERELKNVGNLKKIYISAKESIGIDEFNKAIKNLFDINEIDENDELLITNLRQNECFVSAKQSIELVIEAINKNLPEDFYLIDMANAYEELGKVVGEAVEDDLADKIFAEFCMGK